MSPRAEALEALDQALAVYRAALADADAAAAFASGLGGFDAARAWRAASDADPAVADAASAAITRLRAELTAHPEERARRDRVDAAASESLLRRWA